MNDIILNKNICTRNQDFKYIIAYLEKLYEISHKLNKLKKIHRIYSFYSLNELDIDTKVSFNKLFYGIVPYFVIEKKYVNKFKNYNNKIYIYKNTYYTKVNDLYEMNNFYKLEL